MSLVIFNSRDKRSYLLMVFLRVLITTIKNSVSTPVLGVESLIGLLHTGGRSRYRAVYNRCLALWYHVWVYEIKGELIAVVLEADTEPRDGR